MGCIGRRSPGRRGGRGAPTPPGPCGRGRWKIGCPGTGRPGAGRIVPAGAPACATGAAGRGGGALYTGRGPVCGTIIRGAGVCGAAAAGGGAGRAIAVAAGGAGAAGAEIVGAVGAAGITTATGGGGVGRGAAGGGGAATTTAGFSTSGGATTGRAGGAGATGAATGAAGAGAGVAGFAAGGTTTGLAATGGAAGRTGGAAAASFFCVIAFSTSPGREMCDKSILVLISSSPRNVRADRADDDCPSDEPRMWARTFSASCSSSELEWVFFSVTPTSGSASRMALLLTSSSLARSLIRTLLIRPFFSPRCA